MYDPRSAIPELLELRRRTICHESLHSVGRYDDRESATKDQSQPDWRGNESHYRLVEPEHPAPIHTLYIT